MRRTWRWFGPADKQLLFSVYLQDIRQAGVQGIVTALHEVANGATWSKQAIEEWQALIRGSAKGAETGLSWEVVEVCR